MRTLRAVERETLEADASRSVSAIVVAFNREQALEIVLDRLAELPLREVLVVDNGSNDESAEVARRRGGNVRLLEAKANLGIAARNVGAAAAHGDFLLMLDDDAYPLPGAVEALVARFRADPRLAAAAGLVREVDPSGRVIHEEGLRTFDWWLRGGHEGPVPEEGLPAFFFPEGASMLRKRAYDEAGGYFEPFFLCGVEIDLATRLIGLGWDVRYVAGAVFDHMKPGFRRGGADFALYYRVRNHLWYVWLRFPPSLALRRSIAYLAFDLIESVYRRSPGAWARAVADAWRGRALVRAHRRPLPRAVIRRAELNRGRLHLRLLLEHARRRLESTS